MDGLKVIARKAVISCASCPGKTGKGKEGQPGWRLSRQKAASFKRILLRLHDLWGTSLSPQYQVSLSCLLYDFSVGPVFNSSYWIMLPGLITKMNSLLKAKDLSASLLAGGCTGWVIVSISFWSWTK